MDIHFVEHTGSPEKFFDLLPHDWRAVIVPFWEDYRNTARIFTLEYEYAGQILGGGIVFSSVSPDTMTYKTEAQYWLDQGYLYIGFLWIPEEHRRKRLGSMWLQRVQEVFPERKFWLAIDDYELAAFYQRLGFQVVKKINAGDWEEWIMVKDAKSEVGSRKSESGNRE